MKYSVPQMGSLPPSNNSPKLYENREIPENVCQPFRINIVSEKFEMSPEIIFRHFLSSYYPKEILSLIST